MRCQSGFLEGSSADPERTAVVLGLRTSKDRNDASRECGFLVLLYVPNPIVATREEFVELLER